MSRAASVRSGTLQEICSVHCVEKDCVQINNCVDVLLCGTRAREYVRFLRGLTLRGSYCALYVAFAFQGVCTSVVRDQKLQVVRAMDELQAVDFFGGHFAEERVIQK